MDRRLISEWFDHVPMLYWPVLCLEIVRFHLWAWADAETLGYARQMIVGVSYTGRIRVRFIEDAPSDSEDWRTQLAHHSAKTTHLTADPCAGRGPWDNLASSARADLAHWIPACAGIFGHWIALPFRQPILDPG